MPAKHPAEPADAAVPAGAEHAYERHLAEALALPDDAVGNFFVDPALMNRNVARGTEVVLALKPALASALPAAKWHEVARAPELAAATWHAFLLAERAVAEQRRPFGEHRAAVGSHRDQLLAAATRLVGRKAVAQGAVDKIREGTGAIDMAEDVLALCDLVKGAGKAADGLFTADELATARADAQTFKDRVRPEHQRGGTGKQGEVKAAANRRDRMQTLLVRAYTETRRIGMWQWADGVDRHVPTLSKRIVER